jgi:sorbitol-specific phosphotransferase system component IIA
MISFANINKQYGKQLLFVDASFQLNPGEKVRSSLSDFRHVAIHFQSENNLQKTGRINFFTCSRRDVHLITGGTDAAGEYIGPFGRLRAGSSLRSG